MLERLVKNIGRKITTFALAGTLLLGSGCDTYRTTYRTMSPNLIQPVTPIERPIERPVDYSELTWQEAIEYVQTPEQAQDYLDTHLQQVDEVRYDSFRVNHTDRKGQCFDYATTAAALLSDNGYPATILDLDPTTKNDHAVFVYNSNGRFFALGNTPLTEGYGSIADLANGFQEKYSMKFNKYIIFDLNENHGNEWINGDGELELKRVFPFSLTSLD